MATKLSYGLKKKYQKETNRLGSVDIAYDSDNDEIMLGLALRKDVKNDELIERIIKGVQVAFDAVLGRVEASKVVDMNDVCGYVVKDKKGN